MAGKTKPGKPVKSINIKLKMINDLMDVTGSAKDSWNPAEISDDMKAIAYIHDLADTWNPAQLNEALKYLGFATIDSWNPAIIEETKNKLVKYFLPTDASGNPIELDLKGALPYEVTDLTIDLLPIQDLSHGEPSPTNICPISGRTEVNLTVADAETSPTQTETYTETLGQTVYGGKVDFVSGKLTIEYEYKKITRTAESYTYSGMNGVSFASTLDGSKTRSVGYCSHAKVVTDTSDTQEGDMWFGVGNARVYWVGILDAMQMTLAEFQTYMSNNDVYIAYPLNTPTEVTLTAEQISLLKGNNVLTTDGDNINITYKAILNS